MAELLHYHHQAREARQGMAALEVQGEALRARMATAAAMVEEEVVVIGAGMAVEEEEVGSERHHRVAIGEEERGHQEEDTMTDAAAAAIATEVEGRTRTTSLLISFTRKLRPTGFRGLALRAEATKWTRVSDLRKL
jgi:predicted NBD/HSP70 family sugar kinase